MSLWKKIVAGLVASSALILPFFFGGCGPSKSELKKQNAELKQQLHDQSEAAKSINTEIADMRTQLKNIAAEKAQAEKAKEISEARVEERKKAEKDWEDAWRTVQEERKTVAKEREEIDRVRSGLIEQKRDLDDKSDKLAEAIRKEDQREKSRDAAELEAAKAKDEVRLAKLETELAELERVRKASPTKQNTDQKTKKVAEIAQFKVGMQQRQDAERALSLARSAQLRMLNPQRFTGFVSR